MTINFEGETPLWRQLVDILTAQIESGELASGKVVPSETTLVQRYGLARGTVRKALDYLEAQGLVNRVPGRGTFVRIRELYTSCAAGGSAAGPAALGKDDACDLR